MTAGNPYAVAIAARVAREVRRLPAKTQAAVIVALEALGSVPRAANPLTGELVGIWSLRRGDYRILYRVDDTQRRVEIARIGHRREVYKSVR